MVGETQFRNKYRHGKTDPPHQAYTNDVFEIQVMWERGQPKLDGNPGETGDADQFSDNQAEHNSY